MVPDACLVGWCRCRTGRSNWNCPFYLRMEPKAAYLYYIGASFVSHNLYGDRLTTFYGAGISLRLWCCHHWTGYGSFSFGARNRYRERRGERRRFPFWIWYCHSSFFVSDYRGYVASPLCLVAIHSGTNYQRRKCVSNFDGRCWMA